MRLVRGSTSALYLLLHQDNPLLVSIKLLSPDDYHVDCNHCRFGFCCTPNELPGSTLSHILHLWTHFQTLLLPSSWIHHHHYHLFTTAHESWRFYREWFFARFLNYFRVFSTWIACTSLFYSFFFYFNILFPHEDALSRHLLNNAISHPFRGNFQVQLCSRHWFFTQSLNWAVLHPTAVLSHH